MGSCLGLERESKRGRRDFDGYAGYAHHDDDLIINHDEKQAISETSRCSFLVN